MDSWGPRWKEAKSPAEMVSSNFWSPLGLQIGGYSSKAKNSEKIRFFLQSP